MNDRERRRRGGVVGPLILIALGLVFLLNNLGVLEWTVWEVLLRLWPALLIAAGLDLILGWRSIWGSLLALVLTVVLVAGALWLSETSVGDGRLTETEEISLPLDDVDRAELVIDPGVGTLRIESLADSPILIEGRVRIRDRAALTRDFSVEDGRGSFRLGTEAASFDPFVTSWAGRRVWDLQISASVPLHLETDLAVGETDLDLTGLSLESLRVQHGLGQATIVLPEEGRFEGQVDGAIGQTVVVIPQSLAARIELDTGLAAREMPEDYTCEEDVCTSPEYETANHRAELELSQAIGSLVVRH